MTLLPLPWWFAWCSGLSTIYITYYLTMAVRKPKVICRDEKLRETMAERCPIFFESYWPPIWAFNKHLMTILRAKFQYSPQIEYKRYAIFDVTRMLFTYQCHAPPPLPWGIPRSLALLVCLPFSPFTVHCGCSSLFIVCM